MAPHSSTLAWKIPWMEEPDRLQSMGSLRVRHNSDFTFTFHFHALEKEMTTHSSVLAWRIPGMGEPGGLSSMGSHRVGHDWSDLAAAAVNSVAQLNSVLISVLCSLIPHLVNPHVLNKTSRVSYIFKAKANWNYFDQASLSQCLPIHRFLTCIQHCLPH